MRGLQARNIGNGARPGGALTDLWVSHMLVSMRTTLQLDDALMQDAKRATLESGRTLTAVVEDAASTSALKT